MKVETFVKGSLVAVIFFIAGLTILGDSLLQQKFGVDDAPIDQFSHVYSYKNNLTELEGKMSEGTLEAADSAEVDESQNTGDFVWWTYTTSALKAVKNTVISADKSKGAIEEVGNYLYIHPLIIGGIISCLILSFIFALVAFWKNRRA